MPPPNAEALPHKKNLQSWLRAWHTQPVLLFSRQCMHDSVLPDPWST